MKIKYILTVVKKIFIRILIKAIKLLIYTVCGLSFLHFLIGVLMEPSRDTTLLTNIGFAMFVGISSMLFTWARSLDEKKFPKQVHSLNTVAVISILGSIFFIFSSLFKYLALHNNDPKLWILEKGSKLEVNVLTGASIVCIIGVMWAITFVVIGVFKDFGDLWEKLYNIRPKNPDPEKNDRRTEIS
ncbi:hypothetical protein AY601_4103 [Pedobacter cryoconitis]|uniref:Uncharacterized protein n=1 Tax=Pedobacter cryoconitis TaxID=188932 RepID=A0A127VHZ8_9SPHI|nr:hypothetical protein [Pedobacter cryoconitis]AMQ00954.1 hypothetical protein AY601_4103 [Pedobacter cryoconitis]